MMEKEAHADVESKNAQEMRGLIHDLHTHQIELEMQNEELRSTQLDLLEARDRYSDLYDFAPIGYLTLDPRGFIIEANVTLEDMLSEGRGTLIGKRLTDFIHQEMQDDYFLCISTILEKNERKSIDLQLQDREQKNTCGDTGFWVRIDFRPVVDKNEKIYQLRLSVSDITDHKIGEERLKSLYKELECRVEQRTAELVAANGQLSQSTLAAEQSARSKSEFLASMSHEIRTPLNGVLGMSELLEHTMLDDKQQKYLQIIQLSGNTLKTVINDILDYSRIEVGKLELESSSFCLRKFIEEVVAPFQLTANGDITFDTEIAPEIPDLVNGDRVRLNQILCNLLNNAFKFTKQGSVNLQLNLEEITPSRVVIDFRISDTGIGIAPEKLKTIFLPFTQMDQSTTRPYGGTGLGLAICYRLIDLMGGDITVESDVGKGTCFGFSVCLDIDDKRITNRVFQENCTDFSSLKVLLAEDNPINQLVVKGMLSKLGVQAIVAADGAEAESLVCQNNQHFDLILMDCEMPFVDGYEATRNIRQWESENACSETPIYALTAHVLEEHVNHCSLIGMNGHLSKPVSLKQLRETFDKLNE